MVTRSNVRLGLTGALLLFAFGAFAGCTDSSSPMEVEVAAEGDDPECTIINGMMVCEGTD